MEDSDQLYRRDQEGGHHKSAWHTRTLGSFDSGGIRSPHDFAAISVGGQTEVLVRRAVLAQLLDVVLRVLVVILTLHAVLNGG